MSHKGFRYTYQLEGTTLQELIEVGRAYERYGWKEIGYIPDEGPATHVIFEWQYDGIPVYPRVNHPPRQR